MDHQSLLLLIFKGWLILLIAAYAIKIGKPLLLNQTKNIQSNQNNQSSNLTNHLLMSLSIMLPILIYGANLIAALSENTTNQIESININNTTLIQSGIMQLFMTAACVFAFTKAHQISINQAFFPQLEITLPKWLFLAVPLASIGLILAIQGTLEQSGFFIWLEQTFNAPMNQTTVEWLRTHQLSALTLILLVVQVCIIAPITEEIIFRGIFFKQLDKHFGVVTACILSAIFFALIHAHLIAFVPLFIFAIILNFSFYYTKNLKIPIMTHMIFNSMTIIYQLNFAP